MSTAKETRKMVRDLQDAGLDVSLNGHHHVRDEQNQLVYTLPATPSSQSSVRKSKIATERLIRGEPVRPESGHSGRNSPGKAVSAEPQAPSADEAAEQDTIRRAARRAQQAAEQAADARAAERIKNKANRKAKPKARPQPPKREWVHPGHTRKNKLGAARLTSPTGQKVVYSLDVARKNGAEVRPEDIHVEEDIIFWPKAKETCRAPNCFSCLAPGAAGVLFFLDVRLIDRRDLFLSLGKPFKQAAAMALKDHRLARTTGQKNGEYVSTGSLPLCERCHGRYSKAGPPSGGEYEWVTIADWPAYLASDLVTQNKNGSLSIRKPPPAGPGTQ